MVNQLLYFIILYDLLQSLKRQQNHPALQVLHQMRIKYIYCTNILEAVSTVDSTDSEESHCIVTASVLVESIAVQLFYKVVPFVSTE